MKYKLKQCVKPFRIQFGMFRGEYKHDIPYDIIPPFKKVFFEPVKDEDIPKQPESEYVEPKPQRYLRKKCG